MKNSYYIVFFYCISSTYISFTSNNIAASNQQRSLISTVQTAVIQLSSAIPPKASIDQITSIVNQILQAPQFNVLYSITFPVNIQNQDINVTYERYVLKGSHNSLAVNKWALSSQYSNPLSHTRRNRE